MNIERVKKEFNYSEFVSFDEGLDNTIKWIQILNELSEAIKKS